MGSIEQSATVRLTTLRVLACLFAVSWVVLPGFGAIDLSVTWSSDWPQVLEAGWGLYATVLVGAAFALVAVRPRRSRTGVAQFVVSSVALFVSAAAATEPRLLLLAAGLATQTAIVGALSGRVRDAHPATRFQVSSPVLVLAGLGLVPWLAYALDMWALNREDRSDSDVTLGIDHYSVQGAVGLALVLLPVLAALRRDARPFVAVCAGIVAVYLGIVSYAWPDAAGGFSRAWSCVAIAWGLAIGLGGVAPRLRSSVAP